MQSKPANSCPAPAESAAPRHLYEYAVVKFCPRVERDECVNVGLVMMCKRRRWIKARTAVDATLINLFAPGWDSKVLTEQLKSFESIARGESDSPVAAIEAHERFRWLTAVRSACIVTGRPHAGLTDDLDATFERLYGELVERRNDPTA